MNAQNINPNDALAAIDAVIKEWEIPNNPLDVVRGLAEVIGEKGIRSDFILFSVLVLLRPQIEKTIKQICASEAR